jgi:hypothetical protein
MEWVNDDDDDDEPEISHTGGEREDRVRSAVEYIILPRYLFYIAYVFFCADSPSCFLQTQRSPSNCVVKTSSSSFAGPGEKLERSNACRC